MKTPDIRKNYLYRLGYEILALLVPFITTPYISRVLGADGVGIYSYTLSIMTYFTLFAALGTASYGAREIAQHRDDREQTSKLFWEIELMTVTTSGICLIVWAAVILFNEEYRIYFFALTPWLFSTMADISWYFTGYEQVRYIVIRNTMVKLIGIVLLFVFVRQKDDLLIYFIINSCVQFIGNLTMWMYLPKMLVRVKLKTLAFRRHFRETIVYFIPTIATSIYTVLDKTLIGIITGDSFQNGYYEQATKIINIVKTLVFTSVNSVMGARIAYLFAEKKDEEIHRRIGRSMDFIFLLGYGATFGLIGISDRFVPAFLGSGYEPVTVLLYFMSPLILIVGVSNCLGSQYYTPGGYRAKSAKFIIIGSCLNLFLNLLLIPKFGIYGATVGSVVAEFMISILYLRGCGTYMTGRALWLYSRKRLLAGVIMCGIILVLGRLVSFGNTITAILQVVLGGVIYLGLLLIMKDSMLYELIGMLRKIVRKE